MVWVSKMSAGVPTISVVCLLLPAAALANLLVDPNHPAPHPTHAAPHPTHGVHPPPQYVPTPGPYAPPAGHHAAPHQYHQPAYGYTPAPPAYGYSPTPAPYGYSPAPPAYGGHHQPAGYPAPGPQYSHAGPPHHPTHPPHYEEGPPACSLNTTKTWCLQDHEYPTYDISHAIEYNYAGVAALYKDVLANTENSVDRLVELPQETYLCPSATGYIMPLRAVNTDGKWRIIVNGVKAHYEVLTQTARVEECTSEPGSPCPLVPACYETKCIQKSIYHRFLVYDPYDSYFPFAMESFKLPSSCACHTGAFAEVH